MRSTLPPHIIEAMKKKNLTVGELAEGVGCSIPTLRSILHGETIQRRSMSRDVVTQRIEQKLGVSIG